MQQSTIETMTEKSRAELISEMEDLKVQLREAQESLQAIQSGEVDALVVSGPRGEQVYTLGGADRPYRIIVEEMNEGTVTVGEDGIILYSNRQFARMLSVPLSQVMGSSIYEYVMPSCRNTVKSLLSKRIDEQTKRAEVSFERKDGGRADTYVSFSPLTIDESPVFCGVITDVTSEKKAQKELQETTNLIERIFDSTNILVSYLDKDMTFVRVNHAFAEASGKSQEYFKNRSFFDLYPTAGDREIFRQVTEDGRPYSVMDKPIECFKKGKETLYADWNLQPVKDLSGRVQGVIMTLVDRTDRRLLEKERLQLLKAIEQAGDGIIVTDTAGTIQYINSAIEEISGFSRTEKLGTKLGLLTGGNGISREVRDSLKAEGLWKGQVSSSRKDGTKAEIEATVSAVHDEEGALLNYVVVEHDVTHEIKLEQQMRQMQKMEALGRLAGGIAHDLNNILYPIIINTEMLMEEAGPGTSLHQSLQQVLTSAYRQRDLVKQILAFSRRTEQQLKPISVVPLVKEAVRFLRSSLPSTTEIRQHIDVRSDMVMGDPAQILQAIMNLCSNAAEALDSQAGDIDVSLTNVHIEELKSHPEIKPGEYLKLEVGDTGRGMTREVVERVFEPFFTTKDISKASGMGLAVVHGIVRGHRGAVMAESTPGKGSLFTVYLPLLDENYRQQMASAGSAALRQEKERKLVLLIDDEPMVLSSVQRALERLGYAVSSFRDPEESLDAFRKRPRDFDLVITDQTMPRMTGAQLAGEVMRVRPDIPVILCTGFSEVITEQEAKDMGIRELIMKPATTKDLGEALHRVLKA
ncbi:MAG TPA: PAS domain S-box protein [Deltaproteobacteria bacterium]|nr:PAS domain S-box protein [Deltaproteobacteria bacterium]